MANKYESKIAVTDYRMIIRELNKIEPALVKSFKKDFKSVAQPFRQGIRDAIPDQPPLRGLRRVRSNSGKTWNTGRNAKTVLVKFRSPKKTAVKQLGVLTLSVVSPATIIADMAGRGSASMDGTMTDPYEYHIRGVQTTRRHRINGQGKALIRELGSKPSRYVYPGAEKKGDEALQKFLDVTGAALDEIEREVNGK